MAPEGGVMADPARWTQDAMMDRAARAVGVIDLWPSPRGATLVSIDDIEAMAGALVLLGLSPIHPVFPHDDDAPPVDRPLRPLRGPGDV